jgi:AraC family transcriptional regulator
MLGSKEPLVEIALAAGFADQTHFTRSFKRITGMTPTEFRRIFAAR